MLHAAGIKLIHQIDMNGTIERCVFVALLRVCYVERRLIRHNTQFSVQL